MTEELSRRTVLRGALAAATSAGLTGAGVAVSTFSYDRTRHWFAERGTPGFDATAFARARARVLTDLGTLGR